LSHFIATNSQKVILHYHIFHHWFENQQGKRGTNRKQEKQPEQEAVKHNGNVLPFSIDDFRHIVSVLSFNYQFKVFKHFVLRVSHFASHLFSTPFLRLDEVMAILEGGQGYIPEGTYPETLVEASDAGSDTVRRRLTVFVPLVGVLLLRGHLENGTGGDTAQLANI